MPYILEKLADPDTILCTLNTGQIMEELTEITTAVSAMLDAEPGPLPLLFDARGLSTTLDDVMRAASTVAQGQGAMMHHPNVKEVLVVATDKLVTLGAQGLRSATFGMVKIATFDTMEAALAYCHELAR